MAKNTISVLGIRLMNFIRLNGKLECVSLEVMGKLVKPANKALRAKLEGIPIDNDWLEKYGFDYRSEDDRYFVPIAESLYLEFDEDMKCGIMPEDFTTEAPLKVWGEMRFVHQLQNFYFALTGKELELNDDDDDD